MGNQEHVLNDTVTQGLGEINTRKHAAQGRVLAQIISCPPFCRHATSRTANKSVWECGTMEGEGSPHRQREEGGDQIDTQKKRKRVKW